MNCLLFKECGNDNLILYGDGQRFVLRLEYEHIKGILSIYRQDYSKEEIERLLTEVLGKVVQ